MVQWLGLCTSTAGGVGLIPDWGTKIPQAMCLGQTPTPPEKPTSTSPSWKLACFTSSKALDSN